MSAAVFVFEALIYSSLATKNLLSQFFDISGYSPLQIGLLMSTIPLVSLISNPFWFYIGSHKGEKKVFSYAALVSSLLVWPIFLDGGFVANLILMAVFSFFFSSVIPIGEARIMTHIKRWGGRFDHIRLFGTLGFGITALVTGLLVRRSFFWLFMAMSLALALPLLFREKVTPEERKTTVRKEDESRQRTGNLFSFWLMTIGMFLGISLNSFHNSFIAVLTRERGFDVSVVGIVFMIAAFSEIPFLLYANKIIALLGHLRVLQIGMFAIAIRVLLVSFSRGVLSLFMIEMLHGFTYILMYYSLFDYIHFRLPKRFLVFGQSVFWVVRSGFAYVLGSVVGGLIIESVTTIVAFRLVGIVGIAFALFVLVFGEMNKQRTEVS